MFDHGIPGLAQMRHSTVERDDIRDSRKSGHLHFIDQHAAPLWAPSEPVPYEAAIKPKRFVNYIMVV
jgi:hypothetical protein